MAMVITLTLSQLTTIKVRTYILHQFFKKNILNTNYTIYSLTLTATITTTITKIL